MARKGKDKASAVQRGALDNDAHVHTAVRKTFTGREHIGYGAQDRQTREEMTVSLREPYKSRVRDATAASH